ncbi:MAG: hypothetical protein CMJ39_00965 [Phycisphaerae bacterium]|nr:hypothetical protein [Phycisphaerae bacterium]
MYVPERNEQFVLDGGAFIFFVLAIPLLSDTDPWGIQSPCLVVASVMPGHFFRTSCHSSDLQGRTMIRRCNHRAESKPAFKGVKLPSCDFWSCQAGIQAGSLAVQEGGVELIPVG